MNYRKEILGGYFLLAHPNAYATIRSCHPQCAAVWSVSEWSASATLEGWGRFED